MADEGHHQKALDAAKAIQDLRSTQAHVPLVLTGRVVNGRVHIDQHALDEFARQHPNANGSFIAVNAPFDPDGAATPEAG